MMSYDHLLSLQQLDELEKKDQSKKNENPSENKKVDNRLGGIEAQLRNLSKDLVNLKKNNQQQISSEKKKFKGLDDEFKNVKKDIESLKINIQDNSGDIYKVLDDHKDLSDRLNEQENSSVKAKNRFNGLDERFKKVRKDIDKLENIIKKIPDLKLLETELLTKTKQQLDQQQYSTKVKNRFNGLDDRLNSIKNEITNIKNRTIPDLNSFESNLIAKVKKQINETEIGKRTNDILDERVNSIEVKFETLKVHFLTFLERTKDINNGDKDSGKKESFEYLFLLVKDELNLLKSEIHAEIAQKIGNMEIDYTSEIKLLKEKLNSETTQRVSLEKRLDKLEKMICEEQGSISATKEMKSENKLVDDPPISALNKKLAGIDLETRDKESADHKTSGKIFKNLPTSLTPPGISADNLSFSEGLLKPTALISVTQGIEAQEERAQAQNIKSAIDLYFDDNIDNPSSSSLTQGIEVQEEKAQTQNTSEADLYFDRNIENPSLEFDPIARDEKPKIAAVFKYQTTPGTKQGILLPELLNESSSSLNLSANANTNVTSTVDQGSISSSTSNLQLDDIGYFAELQIQGHSTEQLSYLEKAHQYLMELQVQTDAKTKNTKNKQKQVVQKMSATTTSIAQRSEASGSSEQGDTFINGCDMMKQATLSDSPVEWVIKKKKDTSIIVDEHGGTYYTRKPGYRVQFRAQIDRLHGDIYFSIRVMKGMFDDHIQWPFNQEFRVRLSEKTHKTPSDIFWDIPNTGTELGKYQQKISKPVGKKKKVYTEWIGPFDVSKYIDRKKMVFEIDVL